MASKGKKRLDLLLARVCMNCPVCRQARQDTSEGLSVRFVRRVEAHICPFCRAYERVYGRPAHELLHQKSPQKPDSLGAAK